MTFSPRPSTFNPLADLVPGRARILILSPCDYYRELFLAFEKHEVVCSLSVNLSTAIIEQVTPDVVVAPVLGPYHDILEVAQYLRNLGFGGVLCGITNHPGLNTPLIEAEVRAHCPALRLRLIDRPIRSLSPSRRFTTAPGV